MRGTVGSLASATPSATGPDNFGQGKFVFGYQGAGSASRSTYVDYNNFGAREARMRTGRICRKSTRGQPQRARTGTVTATNQSALMVTAETVGAKSAFPGVSFCNCEYTSWGFWSVDQNRPGFTASGATAAVRDRVHMATWVAGVPAAHLDVPTTGTATYTGHIIGSFKSGNNEYIAAEICRTRSILPPIPGASRSAISMAAIMQGQ